MALLTVQSETVHNQFPLLLLPMELVLEVLDALDFRTLLVCKEVCRFFQVIISQTAALEYKIELAASGMEDGPSSLFSAADKLEKLKKRQAAWNEFKWTEDKSVDLSTGHLWELYGGVLAQASANHRSISFRQLPSNHRGIEEKTWTVDVSDLAVRDFTMDPSQDLLVIARKPRLVILHTDAWLSLEIQLRRLSNGEPHPSAPKPAALSHSLDTSVARVSFAIQICANYLGVLFVSGGEGDNELVVWDWKTGAVHLNITGMFVGSFAFLTNRYVLVASDVCPETDRLEPNLLVYDLVSPESVRQVDQELSYVCSFVCPPTGPWTVELEMSIRSDPAPSYTPDPALAVPFFSSRDNRMYVVTILLTDSQRIKPFVLFIPSSTLISHIETLPCGERRSNILWEDWGPTGTRLMPSLGQSDVWVCYIYGMRFVAPQEVRGDGSITVHVYDFDPPRVALSSHQPNNNTYYTAETTFLDTQGAFEGIITTSLPYQITRTSLRTEGSGFSAVMCSEDNLIIVGTGFGPGRFRILTI